MPSGEEHHKLWRVGWGGAIPVSIGTGILSNLLPLGQTCTKFICTGNQLLIFVGIPLGYWYGSFVDPDMDIVGMTKSDGRLMNKLGILGGLLVSYWTFYGYLFRRNHRSVWTHGPVISTLIRYVYQFWSLIALELFTSLDLSWVWWILCGMFIGTTLSDVIHWAADVLSKEIRR